MNIQKNIIKRININIVKIFTIFIFIFGFNQAFGYTTVSGTISANTTWTTGNTYYISAATTLASGYTLTIEPGVIVKVNNGVALTINGILDVNGTTLSHSIFTTKNDNTIGEVITGSSGSPARGNWEGIGISGAGSNSSIIDYAEIKYPTYGMVFTNSSGTIRNSLIDTIAHGVQVNSSTIPTIESNVIRNATSYGIWLYGGSATITGNEIYNTGDVGIYHPGGSSTITNNNIHNSSRSGIYVASGTPTITGNTIQNNTYYGIDTYNLDLRLVGNDATITNTISGNTLGKVACRGNNITGTTGTLDGSTNDVLITGVVALSSGKTLNIAAGSVIKIANGVGFYTNGTLNVNGTAGSHVIFTSINDRSVGSESLGTGTPGRGNWDRVEISGAGSNASIVDYAEIKYPTYGIVYGVTAATVRNSLIDIVTYGVHSNSSPSVPTLENNVIRNATSYGIWLYGGSATITGNEIYNTTDVGIYHPGGASTITNNYIHNTRSGIYIASGTPTITGNTIQNNTYYGIDTYNLDLRLVGNDATITNTISGNTLGKVACRGNNITGTTGTLDGSTNDVLITGVVALSSGKTLNIAAGSVIKIGNGLGFYINGKLNVNGTSTNHVIFTSINDRSVGNESLGTGTPARGNWDRIEVNGTGTNGSVFNYGEVRYSTYGFALGVTDIVIQNSLIEEVSANGVHFNGTNIATFGNSTIRNTSSYGVYVYAGNGYIYNNNIYNSNNQGIYIGSGTPIIKNNILKGNTGYGIYKAGGTPTIGYNLFFGNTTAPAYNWTLDGTNIVGLDPLFTAGTEYLSAGSPAINTGDSAYPSAINPISGNRYDIGRYEYTGYAPMVFTSSVGSVSGRTLSYEWSFTQDPTNGVNPPTITNVSGTISRDINISCSFDVTKLGNYTLKLVIKDGAIIVGESTNSFTIVNP